MAEQPAAQTDSESETDDSLIPAISTEEARLQTMLEEAKAEAAKLISDAEQQAADRVAATKRELPELMAKRREEALTQARSEAEKEREGGESEVAQLRDKARAQMDAAVARIVDLVCLRGEQ